jgi:hypothetical protein
VPVLSAIFVLCVPLFLKKKTKKKNLRVHTFFFASLRRHIYLNEERTKKKKKKKRVKHDKDFNNEKGQTIARVR